MIISEDTPEKTNATVMEKVRLVSAIFLVMNGAIVLPIYNEAKISDASIPLPFS